MKDSDTGRPLLAYNKPLFQTISPNPEDLPLPPSSWTTSSLRCPPPSPIRSPGGSRELSPDKKQILIYNIRQKLKQTSVESNILHDMFRDETYQWYTTAADADFRINIIKCLVSDIEKDFDILKYKPVFKDTHGLSRR